MEERILTVLLSLLVSLGAALVSAWGMVRTQEKRLRRDFELDRERVRTEFMAEQVAKELLESEQWEKRTFEVIKKRLGGFEDDELRKILVRAGAVRFEGRGDEELWGLLSRNRSALG